MILNRDKKPRKIKPYRWFAWYPVWAWEDERCDLLHFVWLQKVWRTNGYIDKYKHYIKHKKYDN